MEQFIYDNIDNSNANDSNGNFSVFLTGNTSIAPIDVKFNNSPLEEVKKEVKPRKTPSEIELQKRQEEEYDNEAREERYKRLMHLLNKSKFYSSYLINKLEDKSKGKHKERFIKRKSKYLPPVNDENVPPPKKKMRGDIENYNIQEYISTEIKKKVQRKKGKKNLSTEEIETELSTDSDAEPEPQTATAADSTSIVPKYFCGTLRDYQLTGLEWLKLLYKNGLSGILADEMGLGKTVQVIALICHLVEERQPKPYLIIAPLSTIPNWLIEFERFAPAIPVVLFYGTPDEREAISKKIKRTHHVADDFRMQPVVLTTYEVPLHEIKFLQTITWRYIIVDEGQRIKNPNCKLIKMLKTLRSMNRLILTGTPLQNNLAELWSLLNFLLPEIFDDLGTFESWFDVKELQHQSGTEKVLKQEEEKHVLSSLREILKPFMLRRLKSEVCLEIPPKRELVVYAPLTELQHDLYKAVLNYDLQMLSKIEIPDLVMENVNGKRPKRQCVLRSKYGGNDERGALTLQEIENNNEWKINKVESMEQQHLSKWKQYTDVTERNREFLVRIRFGNRLSMYKKIVNHPYLIHCPLDSTGLPKIDNDVIRSSGKLLVLDAMLAKLKVQGHKVLLFSTMTQILDMIEDYLMLRDYNYVRLDGHTEIEARKRNISAFNNDPDMFLFLISTRAGGVGLNLMGADTVIIYDSDWNPQADIQAMARCHRIGQTKPVVVYRLCTRGTIDEKIINRSEAKRILEKIVMSKELQKLNNNSLMDLKRLMESKEYKVVTSENEVFTELELNKILDRSDMMINNHDTDNSSQE
ncbi:PREDICTED: lymphoid-specific helicase-like [Wasmannia auropunctata]|uniref:lymphoid-specific helicase-like n=1 Tax=Wasmannia auropunctata TaxID=64793 RepID=UPI0005EF28B9|nr:PREDICTED: lymphoid-specific helicase-like [Wasmannia auropunctata]XP_011701476.1 PREDICTED: lymphoid-specific helicase-like [Wasmannia auropunctata]